MDSVLPPLEPTTTVLTANRRLARALGSAHQRAQLAAGHGAWESPDCLPYGAWLERCWHEYTDGAEEPLPALLTAEQERALWEQVITADDGGGGATMLLQRAAAAEGARTAWRLLRAFRCPLPRETARMSEDALAFARWAAAFERRCAKGGWIDAGAAWERLLEPIRRRDLTLPRRVWLAGFHECTPQQEAVLAALRAGGVAVAGWTPGGRAQSACRVRFEDGLRELEAAARWARALLEAGVAGPVGVVVPDLALRRRAVERIFGEALHPGMHLQAAPDGTRAYNVSLGAPLRETSVARDALAVLGLLRGRAALADLSRLLRSPHLAGAESELAARARLDVALRGTGRVRWPLPHLIRFLRREEWRVPVAAACLERLAAQTRQLPGPRYPADWAGAFWSALRTAGWPGERPRSGAEHQAVEAFAELLGRFADLGGLLGPQSLDAALERVARMASERIFQPQSAPAPVQVLGVLEAAGLRFTHLWIAGLHSGAWPRSPQPNPFLPLEVQRRHGMPHASPERELEFARRVTDWLLSSAHEVVVSYPAGAGEEPLAPSPLIAHLPVVEASELPASATPSLARHVQTGAPILEAGMDVRAPRLPPGEHARGGVGIFRDQAACPFRAFARHRLQTEHVAEPGLGPDARVRGILAHRLLASLWSELRSHARLAALSPAEREALVDRHVEGVLAAAPAALDRSSRRFLGLERERLSGLARDWLELERARPPFEVLAEEAERRVQMDELTVRLRVDRVDRLPDGRLLVLDYKTGEASVGAWFGARPDDPQLPLYCVTTGEAVAGVAYASLRCGALGLRGLAAEGGHAPGVDGIGETRIAAARALGDWPRLERRWRRDLERLAQAFVAGDARVDPKSRSRSCRGCEVRPLCRIDELDSASINDPGDDPGPQTSSGGFPPEAPGEDLGGDPEHGP